jgi:predicted MFS family arabinose efflux permease
LKLIDRYDTEIIELINKLNFQPGYIVPDEQYFNVQSWRLLCAPFIINVTLLISFIWFALSFGSYGIATWISELYMKTGFNDNPYKPALIYSFANLPGNIAASFLIDYVGSSKLVFWSMILACASAALLAFKAQILVLGGSILYSSFSTAGWNGLDALTGQKFPSNCRSSAFGLASAAGRVGSITANVLNGFLFGEGVYGVAVALASILMLAGAICTYLLPRSTRETEKSTY